MFKLGRKRIDPQRAAADAADRQQRVGRFRDALDGHEASGVFALGDPSTPGGPAGPRGAVEADE